jgi:hypothetical protein
MARITRAALPLSAEEIKTRLKLDPLPWCRQRWLIIYNALVDLRKATDIAKHTGTTVAIVHQVISAYNRLGVTAVETSGKGGRLRQYVTWEEEQAFLAPFFSRAWGNCHRRRNQAGECAHTWDTRSTQARSRACSNSMDGASPCPIRYTRRPAQEPKHSVKKLPGQRSCRGRDMPS